MHSPFDSAPDRRNTDSLKWQRYHNRDVIPMWVADMDFTAPTEILDAIRRRLDHGVLGYAAPWPSLAEAVVEGIARDHNWRIEPDWIVWLPGVVPGFNLAAKLAGQPGSGVLTFPPIYPPCLQAPKHTEKRLIRSDLVEVENHWSFDWDGLSTLDHRAIRLLLLCNPHNPVGRVWTREELLRLARYAEHHDWLICSDDIHCGLVIDPKASYLPIAALDDTIAQRTITLMAPSKTWNIPGLSCAFAIIPNASLRQQYVQAGRGLISEPNLLGMVAAEAAYRHGAPWREALLPYLNDNAREIRKFISTQPLLRMADIEATYLAWIDCRELKQVNAQRHFEHHGVGLSDGKEFGLEGFVRLNFGCSRSTLQEALQRMAVAMTKLDD